MNAKGSRKWAWTHWPWLCMTTGRSQERQWNLSTSCLEAQTESPQCSRASVIKGSY